MRAIAFIVLCFLVGQCSKSPTAVDAPVPGPTTASFVVDTFKVSSSANSTGQVQVTARIVSHFVLWGGTPDFLTFTVLNHEISYIVDYVAPLQPDIYYPWTPKMDLLDDLTGVDSITAKFSISGAFWREESSKYKYAGPFTWSDSQKVLIVRQ